jgi:hypothetical protein
VADGALTDHFDPLTVHIYVAAPATWASAALPPQPAPTTSPAR